MKKNLIKLFVVLGVFFMMGTAYAATCDISFSGNTTITEGDSTTIYVKVNSSDVVKGADLTYSNSGSITLSSAGAVNLSVMAQNGNRYVMYSADGVSSGSNIFKFDVKGASKGTGTISITNIETSIDNTTVVCSPKSINITVNEQAKEEVKENTPVANNNNTNNNNTTVKQEEKKEETKVVEKEKNEEPVISEAEKKYNKALELVKKAEKTKQLEDVNAAKKAVEELDMSDNKYKLLNRLLELMLSIKNDNTETNITTTGNGKELTTNASGTPISWMLLSIILIICLAIETIYLIVKDNKKKEEVKEV